MKLKLGKVKTSLKNEMLYLRRLKSGKRFLQPKKRNDAKLLYHECYGLIETPKCARRDCNNEATFVNFGKGYLKCCSDSCARKWVAERQSNHFKGKKHTNETKAKMSRNHADFSGDKNPFRNAIISDPGKRQALVERRVDYWKNLTDEQRVVRSTNQSLGQRNRRVTHTFGKGGYYWNVLKNNGDQPLYYRSSWEEIAIECLERHPCVQSYAYESLRLNVETRLGWRLAIPDFLVTLTTGHQVVLEIKPDFRIETESWKLIAVQDYCLQNGFNYLVLGNSVFDSEAYEKINEVIDKLTKGEYNAWESIRFRPLNIA